MSYITWPTLAYLIMRLEFLLVAVNFYIFAYH